MKIFQLKYTPEKNWQKISDEPENYNPDLILVFGSTQLIKDRTALTELKNKFPKAILFGGTTAGEICETNVFDHTIIATCVQFNHTRVAYYCAPVNKVDDSYDIGKRLVEKMPVPDLQHVLVISEGLNINGSQLVKGLREAIPPGVSITGGLAGDGDLFKETFVLDETGKPQNNLVSAVGFYGKHLNISYGSLGGWDSFGVERLVTKSINNKLFELDGKPALELYKEFLGEKAKDLPASGLFFPLNLRIEKDSEPVVRTILAVDESNQSLTFAGNIPEGAYVRLMKANFDNLIEGAVGAAKKTMRINENENPQLALLISCVGRKLVLKQIIEEEVEGVREVLGNDTILCGFYSYGEISPFSFEAKCELHNQTMTITTFNEK